jgi:hypothetical protein
MELGLTKDEEEIVQRGAELYKTTYLDTIDNIFTIARALKILQDRHRGSGIRGGLADALVQYGFTSRDGGPMNKAIRSFHTQCLDNEDAIRKWWAEVPERAKRDWLSAKAIYTHWNKTRKPARTTPSHWAQMRATNSSAEHVIKSVGNLFRTSPKKLRAIATGLTKFAKDIEDLTKTARPKRGTKR